MKKLMRKRKLSRRCLAFILALSMMLVPAVLPESAQAKAETAERPDTPDIKTDDIVRELMSDTTDGVLNESLAEQMPSLDAVVTPEGRSDWYTGLKINAALKDAYGNGIEGQSLLVFVDGLQVTTALCKLVTDAGGCGEFIWRPEQGVKNEGRYTIEIKYPGMEGKYSECYWKLNEDYSLDKLNQEFRIAGVDGENTINSLTYGDEYYIRLENIRPQADIDENTYPASTSLNFAVRTIDGADGTDYVSVGDYDAGEMGYPLFIKKGGIEHLQITVTQTATPYYNEFSQTLTIGRLNKKKAAITAVAAEPKAYDGNAQIAVSARLNMDDIVAGDKAVADHTVLHAVGIAQNVNAGVQAVNVTFDIPADSALFDKYELANEGRPDDSVWVNINKARLSLTVSDAGIDYTKLDDPQAETNLVFGDFAPVIVEGFADGECGQVLEGYADPSVYLEMVSGEERAVGKTCGVLRARGGYPTDNYEFDFDGQKAGILTLLEEQVCDGHDYITYNGGNHTYAPGTDDSNISVIYYGGDRPMAIFSIRNKTYTRIMLLNADGSETDITEGLVLDSEAVSQSFEVYLCNGGEGKPSTLRTSKFALPQFKRDSQKPRVSIAIEAAECGFDKFLSALTFGFYKNSSRTLEAEICVDDVAADNEVSSGISRWSYCVAHTNADVTLDADNDTRTITYGQWQDAFGSQTFTPVSPEDGLSKSVEIQTEEDNNYIIFVMAEDHVGNTSLYGSNGIIVENISPNTMDIGYKTMAAEGAGDGYFKNDVELDIHVTENTDNGMYSGIASVDMSVTMDGVAVSLDESGAMSRNLYMRTAPEHATLKELKEGYCSLDLSAVVPGILDASKKVEAVFTATDFAGNTATTTKEFVIDPVAPKISSQYGPTNALNAPKVRDGVTYYQGDVVLKTIITERFLDIDNAVEYKINGNTAIKLGTLRNGNLSDYGIKALSVEHDAEGRTDSSESVITVVFSAEDTYAVSVGVKDMAGSCASTGTDTFVIDKTNPEVSVTYTDLSSKMTFIPSKDSRQMTYLNAQCCDGIRVDLSVTDANFDPQCTRLNIDAVNGAAASGEPVQIPRSQWVKNGNVYTYTLLLDTDANYTLDVTCEDLSGRRAVYINGVSLDDDYGMDYFSLDREAPTGDITVTDLVNVEGGTMHWFNQLINIISFGIFGRQSITAEIKCGDRTSGVADIAYLTTDEDQLTEHDLEAREGWKTYGGPVDLGANQNLFIYVRVEDMAGNTAFYSTAYMSLDDQSAIVRITADPAQSGRNKGIYNEKEFRGFSVRVEEPAAAGKPEYYSGLRTIDYKITAVDNAGNTRTIAGGGDAGYKRLASYGREGHVDYYDGTIQFEPLMDRSCHYTVDIHVEDWSGNCTEKSLTVVIDPKPPEIDHTVTSSADRLNGMYYNKDVLLSTTITERYLDIYRDVIYMINNHAVSLEELIAKKGAYGVSLVKVIHDNNENARTDSTTSIVQVIFHDDNTYNVSVAVTDKAGHETSKAERTFVIDQTAPTATLTYYSYGSGETFTAGKSEDRRTYLGEAYNYFKVEITVEEINFTDGRAVHADYTVNAVDSRNNVILEDRLMAYTDNAKLAQNWQSPSAAIHKYFVDISQDANYTFDFAYEDLAGNPLKVQVDTGCVTLDRGRPTGTVTVSGLVNGTSDDADAAGKSWFMYFIQSITFGLFGKNNLSAAMESDDATAGVAVTQYLCTAEYLTRDALARRTDWTDYSGSIKLQANQNVTVYQKVVDKAGNTEYYSTDHLVADAMDPAPVVTLTPSSPSWNKGVYSAPDNPGVDITVTDPAVNGTYSGLKDITYKIVNGSDGYTEAGTLAAMDRGAHQQSWSGHVDIHPELFYSNDVRITVTASDWSANTASQASAPMRVDNQAPLVQFSFDTSDAQHGKYYKNNKILTVTVHERNFDPSFIPAVTSTAGGGYAFSGWSVSGETATGTVTFSGDGDYTVAFDCWDLAGNKSNTEHLEAFTVDQTLPVISVAYDNNNVINGRYYNAPRTATITIIEHNFRAEDVRVTATAALKGSALEAPVIGDWSSYGDRHSAVISFQGDGDYTFDIDDTDMAGNASTDYAMDSFTVDKTGPKIVISGVADKSANKGTVAPVISLSDVNFQWEAADISLSGANKGKINVDGMISRSHGAEGATVCFENFDRDMDDIYTLTVKAADKAGNETSERMTFSVNRNGSAYIINEATQKLLETGFTNHPQNLVIQEINVDTLEFVELTYSRDGQVVKLTPGTDYAVKTEGGNGRWRTYTYTIFSGCFETEGAYILNIYSEDRAANTMTNKVKGKCIEFIVDKTPPAVSIANLENRGRYKEDSHLFTLSVKDNTVLAYVDYYLDDELVHTYTAQEFKAADGIVAVQVDSKAGFQKVMLIACDAAGNSTEPIEYDVLVASSGWVQFFMNRPLFFGSMAAAAFVAGTGGLLIFRAVKGRKRSSRR